MKALKTIAACAAVVSIALFASGCSDAPDVVPVAEQYDSLPPGFILVTNQYGVWRAMIENTRTVCDPYDHYDTSRERAVARAWGQYNYQENEKRQVWTRAE